MTSALRLAAAAAAVLLVALAAGAAASGRPPASSALSLVDIGSFSTRSTSPRPRGVTFLDTSSSVSTTGEGGRLSIAFPPDYATSGRFFAYYTTANEVRVSSFAHDPGDVNHASPASESVLASWSKPSADQHYGQRVAVGPDGKVYVATGDGGPLTPTDAAQQAGSRLGKLLRLNRDGSLPTDNPSGSFVYALGLRNPYGMTFDRQSGDLVIADIGRDQQDEIDDVAGGARAVNFGWPCYEGTLFIDAVSGCSTVTNYVPSLTISHDGKSCLSVIGGVIIPHPDMPSLSGRYVYGDYCWASCGRSRCPALEPRATRRSASASRESVDAFGEDGCGRVYAVSLEGHVYRLQEGRAKPNAC